MPLFGRKRSEASRATGGRTVATRSPDRDWRTYDAIAPTFARVTELMTGPPARDLAELLEIREGHRVLDVGTGSGVAARSASALVPNAVVVGIDPSLPMLREAAARGATRVAAASSIDLPFRDATFDRISASFVLSHFPDYRTALFDVMRVLKPGGRLGATAWAASDRQDSFHEAWMSAAEEFAEHEMLIDARRRAMPWDELFSNKDRLKDALHDAGLRDIRVEEREYRVEMQRDEYLAQREIGSMGRFLHEMLGDDLWPSFQRRANEVFAERFPDRFNDFHQVLLAVGHKP